MINPRYFNKERDGVNSIIRNSPPLLSLWLMLCLGILAAERSAPWIYPLVYLLIPVGLLLMPALLKRRPSQGLSWIFFFLWGVMLVCRTQVAVPDGTTVLRHDTGENVWVQGRVTTLFPERGEKISVVLAVDHAGSDLSRLLPAAGRLKLTLRDMTDFLEYRDRVTVQGKVRRFHNFANPGGFDYAGYMKQKCIDGALYGRADTLSMDKPSFSRGGRIDLIRQISRFRHRFSRHIDETVNNPDAAGLIKALVLGERRHLPTELQTLFSRCGVSHLLAVSGMHLSIVAAMFFFIFQRFLEVFTPLLIRGMSRRGAALMTLLPVAGYALVSGFSPATQRALVMVSVFMCALAAERENVTLNALAAAGILILLLQPHALFFLSFQLSFTAVIFIILGLDVLRQLKFPSFSLGVANKIILFFMVSLLAVAGTQPLVMRYFNMASFAGVPINAVAVPVIGFGVLPLGLAALVLFTFFPSISTGCLVAARGLALPCIDFFRWVAHLPGTWSRTVTPDLVYLTAWYLAMGGVYLYLRHGKKRRGLLMAGTALIMFLVNAGLDVRQRFFNPDLEITVLDVGQGNSAMVRLPGGGCFLVDGGGFSSRSVFDPGRYLVAPFLWRNHILTLDGVVLTHPEADHMNGLVFILENFNVGVLYKNTDTRRTRAYGKLMALARSRGTQIHTVDAAGELLETASGARLRFLPGFPEEASMKNRKKDYNNNSLVLSVAFGDFSMLFPGDVMALRETALTRFPAAARVYSLLMVPHHGSGTSSSAAFLNWVSPDLAVVSCGWRNRFHFPHSRVVKRYAQQKIPLLRTDRDGAVSIRSDGKSWTAHTTRPRP